MKPFLIRDSRASDVPTITAIYAHWVTHGLASFEIEPPEDSEMARRRDAVLAAGFPFLVAEAPEALAPGIAADMKRAMEQVAALSVPLTVDVGIGTNWGAAH